MKTTALLLLGWMLQLAIPLQAQTNEWKSFSKKEFGFSISMPTPLQEDSVVNEVGSFYIASGEADGIQYNIMVYLQTDTVQYTLPNAEEELVNYMGPSELDENDWESVAMVLVSREDWKVKDHIGISADLKAWDFFADYKIAYKGLAVGTLMYQLSAVSVEGETTSEPNSRFFDSCRLD